MMIWILWVCISTERRYHVRISRRISQRKDDLFSVQRQSGSYYRGSGSYLFWQKILGDGVAVIPSEELGFTLRRMVRAAVFDTLRTFTMTTTQGVRLLHIGLDTVILGVFLLHHIFLLVIKWRKGDLWWRLTWSRLRQQILMSLLGFN